MSSVDHSDSALRSNLGRAWELLDETPEVVACRRVQAFKDGNASELDLSGLGLETLDGIGLKTYPLSVFVVEAYVSRLIRLELGGNELKEIPDWIGRFEHLTRIDISDNEDLHEIPSAVAELPALEELIANRCTLTRVPEIKSSVLRVLELSETGLETFTAPTSEQLETLSLDENRLTELPSLSRYKKSLKKLDICCNYRLRTLPKDMGQLEALEKLSANTTGIIKLPVSILKLPRNCLVDLGNTPLGSVKMQAIYPIKNKKLLKTALLIHRKIELCLGKTKYSGPQIRGSYEWDHAYDFSPRGTTPCWLGDVLFIAGQRQN